MLSQCRVVNNQRLIGTVAAHCSLRLATEHAWLLLLLLLGRVLRGSTLHRAENVRIFVRITRFYCPLYFVKFAREYIENIANFFALNVSKHAF